MNVIVPSTINELWSILGDCRDAALCAGGTDILVKVRAGIVRPAALVCLERLDDFRGIRDEGETVFIGACTTHTEILASPIVAACFPVLRNAVHVLGSPPVRNMATIGGNICTASPAGDTLPALYVLDAELEIRSQTGMYLLPVGEFITGPGKTVIRSGEVLAGVRIRKKGLHVQHFEKVGQRKAMSISIASLAATACLDEAKKIEKISLAWGSVGPTVIRSEEIEAALIGKKLAADELRSVFPLIKKVVSPISDVRAGAFYRKTVSANLLLRLSVNGGQQR